MRSRRYVVLAQFLICFIVFAGNPVAASDFRNRADILMENLVKQRFEQVVADFSPQLAARHPAAELEEIWYKTIDHYGPYQNYHFGEEIEKDSTISYLYVIQFESATFAVVAAYDTLGQVVTFILRPPEDKPVVVEPFWIVPDYRAAEMPNLQIPPYVDTSLFREVDFVMKGGTPIPATMTVAQTDEPNPVVLLFQGFGPTDRDETAGSIKPLRDIAWGLASRGIASIRFDPRAFTQPPDSIAACNLNRYLLDDVAALLAYIRMETAIFDTTRIFIAAHGLGGMAAPLAAQNDGGLAGLILLSVPARPFGKMLAETVENDMHTRDKAGEADRAILEKIAEILKQLEKRQLPPDEMILFAPAQVWYDLMDHSQVEIAGQLNLPILLINSGRDFKTAETDFQIWKKALGDHKNVRFKRYENLNHFYQPGLGPAGKADYTSNNAPVDGQVIEDIAAWIKSK